MLRVSCTVRIQTMIPQVEDTIPRAKTPQEVEMPRHLGGRMYARCNLHCTHIVHTQSTGAMSSTTDGSGIVLVRWEVPPIPDTSGGGIHPEVQDISEG